MITVQPLNSSCVSTSASLRRPQASNQATGRNTGTVSTVRNTRPLTPPPCTCSQRYSFWSTFATGPTTFFSSSTFNSCGNYLVYFLLIFYPIHYLIFQEKKKYDIYLKAITRQYLSIKNNFFQICDLFLKTTGLVYIVDIFDSKLVFY